jgi:hypothetical protein
MASLASLHVLQALDVPLDSLDFYLVPHLDFAGGEMVAMMFWWCCGWCRAAGVL